MKVRGGVNQRGLLLQRSTAGELDLLQFLDGGEMPVDEHRIGEWQADAQRVGVRANTVAGRADAHARAPANGGWYASRPGQAPTQSVCGDRLLPCGPRQPVPPQRAESRRRWPDARSCDRMRDAQSPRHSAKQSDAARSPRDAAQSVPTPAAEAVSGRSDVHPSPKVRPWPEERR